MHGWRLLNPDRNRNSRLQGIATEGAFSRMYNRRMRTDGQVSVQPHAALQAQEVQPKSPQSFSALSRRPAQLRQLWEPEAQRGGLGQQVRRSAGERGRGVQPAGGAGAGRVPQRLLAWRCNPCQPQIHASCAFLVSRRRLTMCAIRVVCS